MKSEFFCWSHGIYVDFSMIFCLNVVKISSNYIEKRKENLWTNSLSKEKVKKKKHWKHKLQKSKRKKSSKKFINIKNSKKRRENDEEKSWKILLISNKKIFLIAKKKKIHIICVYTMFLPHNHRREERNWIKQKYQK